MSNEPVVKAHGIVKELGQGAGKVRACLLYTSDAADERVRV